MKLGQNEDLGIILLINKVANTRSTDTIQQNLKLYDFYFLNIFMLFLVEIFQFLNIGNSNP